MDTDQHCAGVNYSVNSYWYYSHSLGDYLCSYCRQKFPKTHMGAVFRPAEFSTSCAHAREPDLYEMTVGPFQIFFTVDDPSVQYSPLYIKGKTPLVLTARDGTSFKVIITSERVFMVTELCLNKVPVQIGDVRKCNMVTLRQPDILRHEGETLVDFKITTLKDGGFETLCSTSFQIKITG